MRKFKFRWIVLALVAAPFVYNLDAFYGAWKFSRLCKNEGGPRYYAAVERNVGWRVEDSSTFAYQGPFVFQDIAFVRWRNKAGKSLDVRVDRDIQKMPYPRRSEYVFFAADEPKPVRYKYVFESNLLPGDARMGRTREQIVDLETGRLAASFTQFSYRWTSPERVLLNAPTGVQCEFQSADYDQFRRLIFQPIKDNASR